MNKYSPPLVIHWFTNVLLIILSIAGFFSVALLFLNQGKIMLHGLQYNIEGFAWLRTLVAVCMASVSLSSVMVLRNYKWSLTYLAIAILMTSCSIFFHPEFNKLPASFIITIMIVCYILLLENKRESYFGKNGTS